MAKKKGIYAPGELVKLREKLKVSDREEAAKLAQKIGGEIGFERTDDEETALHEPPRVKRERVNVRIGNRRRRSLDTPYESEVVLDGFDEKRSGRPKITDPGDDPLIPVRSNYWERIRMDRYAAQPEFEIKSPGQVFSSMISFFSDANDYINPAFITRRMPEYYKKLEELVLSTRNLLPRNNLQRNERMKKGAPIAFSILDVIRYWDIEKISSDLSKIQARPRNVRAIDFADIIKAVYRPLYILNRLDLDVHIRGAYKILYKLLYIENQKEAQEKSQDLIRTAVSAFSGVRRDIQYLLYPLFMKLVSASFVPYELFFEQRKNRIMSFLNVSESSQINPEALAIQGGAKDLKPGDESSQSEGFSESGEQSEEKPEKTPEQEEEEKARRNAEEAEKKAFERGLQTLETLFPKAGWDRLPSYPDLYPYFVDVFDLRRGFVNIAPTDPMQQIYILMRIVEELFFGLRYVNFGVVSGAGGKVESLDMILGEIISNWQYYLETCFDKEYLPRLTEYIRILEGSIEERNSPYTRRLISELHWVKRLYFLPFYKFELRLTPPTHKSDVTQIYAKIKTLRKYLSAVAANIEQARKSGGAEENVSCDTIDNPWAPYEFQIPNPLSKRLNALLKPKLRNNASLVYFSLAIITVLDHLVNNEDSWAYGSQPGPLFRSANGEGVMPLTGVDNKVNADAIFKQTLLQRQKKE